MSASAPALVRAFRVGPYEVTLTFPRPIRGQAAMMAAEWSPSTPPRLNRREWRQYRRGRDAAVAELVRLTGFDSAAVFEA